MTRVTFNQRPIEKRMNHLFEDLFQSFPSKFLQPELNPAQPLAPVNIRETEKAYLLELVAPGLDKEDFKVNIDNQLLTVSAEKKTGAQQDNERQVRREYTYRSFARTFTLDESVNTERISARYENGVLHLELPKKEEAKIQPKEISIQ
jgi:HSP20 family protein